MAATLEGEAGPTPAGKTLPHSYTETRFRREMARDASASSRIDKHRKQKCYYYEQFIPASDAVENISLKTSSDINRCHSAYAFFYFLGVVASGCGSLFLYLMPKHLDVYLVA